MADEQRFKDILTTLEHLLQFRQAPDAVQSALARLRASLSTDNEKVERDELTRARGALAAAQKRRGDLVHQTFAIRQQYELARQGDATKDQLDAATAAWDAHRLALDKVDIEILRLREEAA
jgi:hypothetical protein